MGSEQKQIPRGGPGIISLISRERKGHNCSLEIKPSSSVLDSSVRTSWQTGHVTEQTLDEL